MNFSLSEEQSLLADTVGRQFGEHQEKRQSSDLAAEWADYAALGLTALPYPPAQGGLGGGWAEIMIIMEAFGRTLGRTPYLQSVLLGGRLLAAGEGDCGRALLHDVIGGTAHVALAHEERIRAIASMMSVPRGNLLAIIGYSRAARSACCSSSPMRS